MTQRSDSPTGHLDWRRFGACYQVYPRSFADSDGDGIGDIRGIVQRLPHIASLGVDSIWVSPWYPSPFRDGGYDIADYCDVHPWFGTLDEAELLFKEAAASGLRVLLDLVVNHTSNEHEWFRHAVAARPGSAARGRYHVRRGAGPDGTQPPNDWESAFGGPAWSPLGDGDWYLHLFDASQPDLNWSSPDVQRDVHDAMRFWIELGASGFRVDAAQCFAKDPAYPDWRGRSGDHVIPFGSEHPYRGRPELHDIVRGLRDVLDGYGDRELLLVAENILSPWPRLAEFVRPGEYHQVFNFEYLETPWDGERLRAKIVESLDATAAVGALPAWTLSNHDSMRPATRFGLPPDVDPLEWLADGDRSLLDVALGLRRARAGAMLAMALPGSYYCFQGEELGLPEVHDLPLDLLDDPIHARSGGRQKGRDGCRAPIPWTEGGPSFGFGRAGAWLPQPSDWGDHSVEEQSGRPGSTLELFRRCLAVRAERLAHERFEWVDVDGAIAFRRDDVVCVTTAGGRGAALPAGRVIAASEPPDGSRRLPADATAWIDTSGV